jgi:hypothetical protein
MSIDASSLRKLKSLRGAIPIVFILLLMLPKQLRAQQSDDWGYGNFVSTSDTIGVTLTKNLSLNGGYQLGSRLVVDNNDSSKRIGVRLTQKGAIVGLEYSF